VANTGPGFLGRVIGAGLPSRNEATIYDRGRFFSGCSRHAMDLPVERHLRGGWPGRSTTKCSSVASASEIISKSEGCHNLALRGGALPYVEAVFLPATAHSRPRQPRKLQTPGWPGASEQSEFQFLTAPLMAACVSCGLSGGIPPPGLIARTAAFSCRLPHRALPTAASRGEDGHLGLAAGYQPPALHVHT